MAELKQGIGGPAKGKIGNTVHYTMYGKHFVRSLPEIGKFKQTPKRLKQQQRMSLVVAFLQPFKDIIRITFSALAKDSAPYHKAKSYNLRNAIKGDVYPDQEIDLYKSFLSAGALHVPEIVTITKHEKGLLFEWSKEEGHPNDTLLVIAYNSNGNSVEYKFTGEHRSTGSFMWERNSRDEDAHIWVAFRKSDETEMSNSHYLGIV